MRLLVPADHAAGVAVQWIGHVHQGGRADVQRLVFPEAESETVVDTYVHYCRRKLGKSCIRTIRGRGFCLGQVP